ncbi:DegV family protein [Haploplasma axanthum]|uniref:EDD domain-containing protein, DegV family n=1 Tax=Haploplasma axanthum TaxID=29552 RepID=A0A449BBB4_HAPAX|nr:DegV family protein [Haploplasma axanthum]VEU79623.1 EDD domain-containing protein, DegV family [Haploplasma axanthum]
MRKIGFVVDSTFGYKGNEDVSIVPLKVIINGYEYVEGEFSNEIVVNTMKEKRDVKTSQPAPSMFVDAFEKQFSNGYDYVICLTISSALSGTINGANVAKGILENENIFIIDTKTASVGSDYILEEALKLANKGMEVNEVIDHINEIITKGSLIFSVDDLSTLVKNGRLGKVSALIGSILKIKPILRFKEGVLTVEAKVRGLMAVFKYIKEQVVSLISDSDVIVRITYVDNIEYAKTLEETINNINNGKVNVQIKGILSPVISAHVGLGGMGIYLVTK